MLLIAPRIYTERRMKAPHDIGRLCMLLADRQGDIHRTPRRAILKTGLGFAAAIPAILAGRRSATASTSYVLFEDCARCRRAAPTGGNILQWIPCGTIFRGTKVSGNTAASCDGVSPNWVLTACDGSECFIHRRNVRKCQC